MRTQSLSVLQGMRQKPSVQTWFEGHGELALQFGFGDGSATHARLASLQTWSRPHSVFVEHALVHKPLAQISGEGQGDALEHCGFARSNSQAPEVQV